MISENTILLKKIFWNFGSQLLYCGIIIILIGFHYSSKTENYTKEKPTDCILIAKYPIDHKHKQHVSTDFTFVLKDMKGRAFDITVSPTIFSLYENGTKLNFILSEKDINKNKEMDNYINIQLFCIMFGIMFSFVGIIAFCAIMSTGDDI